MANFKFDVDADGIALITWDMPGRSMNVIDARRHRGTRQARRKGRGRRRHQGRGHHLRQGRPSAAAPISRCWSGWRATFADMAKAQGEEAADAMLFDESRKLSQLYRRLETCGKPWVCALNGTAMGGGFELALACHHRVAADNPKTRLGLPEIKVGLFPGAGGTQRIARMLQPADALQFLLKGDQLKLDRAKAMKLVDAVVPPADLIKTAKDWIKAGGKAVAPWDEKASGCPAGRSIPRPA